MLLGFLGLGGVCLCLLGVFLGLLGFLLGLLGGVLGLTHFLVFGAQLLVRVLEELLPLCLFFRALLVSFGIFFVGLLPCRIGLGLLRLGLLPLLYGRTKLFAAHCQLRFQTGALGLLLLLNRPCFGRLVRHLCFQRDDARRLLLRLRLRLIRPFLIRCQFIVEVARLRLAHTLCHRLGSRQVRLALQLLKLLLKPLLLLFLLLHCFRQPPCVLDLGIP